MKRSSPLWGSVSVLIGVVIAILALVRGAWLIPLLLLTFTAWGLWVVMFQLQPAWDSIRGYWCVVLENEYLSISELRPLLCEISATEVDFPDLLPDDSDRTRSFSMEFSRALLQHAMHASWGYEHLTEDYLMLIDVDISPDNMITNGGRNDGSYEADDAAHG